MSENWDDTTSTVTYARTGVLRNVMLTEVGDGRIDAAGRESFQVKFSASQNGLPVAGLVFVNRPFHKDPESEKGKKALAIQRGQLLAVFNAFGVNPREIIPGNSKPGVDQVLREVRKQKKVAPVLAFSTYSKEEREAVSAYKGTPAGKASAYTETGPKFHALPEGNEATAMFGERLALEQAQAPWRVYIKAAPRGYTGPATGSGSQSQENSGSSYGAVDEDVPF